MRKVRPKIEVDPVGSDVRRAVERGPLDERRDAMAAATRHVAPSAQEVLDRLGESWRQDAFQMAKAARAQERERPGVIMARVPIDGTRAQQPTLTKPGLQVYQMREIVKNDIQLEMIISRRISMVQRFLEPSSIPYEPGYQLRFKSPGRKVRDADEDRFAYLMNFLANCGAAFDPRRRRQLRRDDLYHFIAKHLRDSLTADHAPIEFSLTGSGRVHGFGAVDAANVFLTDPDAGLTEHFAGQEFDLMHRVGLADPDDPDDIIALYAEEGVPRGAYTHENLLLPVRNVSTDKLRFGYGISEVEVLVRYVTMFLNAITVNGRAISDNSIPPGLLMLFGDFSDDDIDGLRQDWHQQVTGASNRGRLPVMVAPGGAQAGAQFVNTGTPITELMWAKWITLLTVVKCGAYQMDPAEIGFESYTSGTTSSLSGSDTEAKLVSSRDGGLIPLMTWTRNTLNDVLNVVDPDVKLVWTGLMGSREEGLTLEKELMLFEERRERHGLSTEGISEFVLKAPTDPGMQAVYQSEKQQAAQAQGLPGTPTGEQRDVDGDGQAEHGHDTDGDGETDIWAKRGPGGELHALDHQGNRVQLDRPEGGPGGPLGDEEGDGPAQRLSKAVTVPLELWP